jgi:hypothetical protein
VVSFAPAVIIGGKGDGETRTRRRAVERRDHRLGCAGDDERLPPHPAEIIHAVPAGGIEHTAVDGGEIQPGAEATTGAGEEDDIDAIVVVCLLNGGDHLVGELVVERVQPLGTVEGDGANVIAVLGKDGLVRHGVGAPLGYGVHHGDTEARRREGSKLCPAGVASMIESYLLKSSECRQFLSRCVFLRMAKHGAIPSSLSVSLW